MPIVKWTPENVTRMVMTELQRNAEEVGKFVETEARAKLRDISDPDTKRDRAYRHYLQKYILTNVVEREPNGITIRVGMRIGTDGQRYHGFYIETGSSTAAAHPFLRPAVFGNQKKILSILCGVK